MHIANTAALICLTVKADLDLSKRKVEGDRIDSRDIKKHKNDVFRLGATMTGSESFIVPGAILSDVTAFVDRMEVEKPDLKHIFKSMGIRSRLPATLIL